MATVKKAKKRGPQDLTLRNLRKLKRDIAELKEAVGWLLVSVNDLQRKASAKGGDRGE